MTVPRASSLGKGVAVNIVLKKDQPSGKLTIGKIKDILTYGDHPRGIKVRLEDGQIGRVQSLMNSVPAIPEMPLHQSISKPFTFQEDVRNQPQPPPAERSLEDYIKVKPAKKGKAKKTNLQSLSDTPRDEDLQASLEKEFSSLDPSLIAAILSDSGEVDAARNTLEALVADQN